MARDLVELEEDDGDLEDEQVRVDRLLKERWVVEDQCKWTIFEDLEDELWYHRRRSRALCSFVRAYTALQKDRNRLEAAGLGLQEAYEQVQDELNEMVGDVAYWRELAKAGRDSSSVEADSPATAMRDARGDSSVEADSPGTATGEARGDSSVEADSPCTATGEPCGDSSVEADSPGAAMGEASGDTSEEADSHGGNTSEEADSPSIALGETREDSSREADSPGTATGFSEHSATPEKASEHSATPAVSEHSATPDKVPEHSATPDAVDEEDDDTRRLKEENLLTLDARDREALIEGLKLQIEALKARLDHQASEHGSFTRAHAQPAATDASDAGENPVEDWARVGGHHQSSGSLRILEVIGVVRLVRVFNALCITLLGALRTFAMLALVTLPLTYTAIFFLSVMLHKGVTEDTKLETRDAPKNEDRQPLEEAVTRIIQSLFIAMTGTPDWVSVGQDEHPPVNLSECLAATGCNSTAKFAGRALKGWLP